MAESAEGGDFYAKVCHPLRSLQGGYNIYAAPDDFRADFETDLKVIIGEPILVEALRRRTTQITPNAAGVREYAPGDALSRIPALKRAPL